MSRSRFSRFAVVSLILLNAWACGGCAAMRNGPSGWSQRASHSLMQSGLAAQEAGQLNEAYLSLAGAVKICPQNVEARRRYAEYLWENGERKAALEQMWVAIKLQPDDATMRRRVAAMLLDMNDLDEALLAASDAVKLDPGNARAWFLRGKAFELSGREEDAIVSYQRAAGCEPGNIEVREAMALLYLRRGHPEQAILTIHTLIDQTTDEQNLATAHLMEGRIYAYLQRADDAMRCFAESHRLRPTDETGQILLAFQRYNTGVSRSGDVPDTSTSRVQIAAQNEPLPTTRR